MSDKKKKKKLTIRQQLELSMLKNKQLQNEILRIIEESKSYGQHLIDESFIPEYLGFEGTVHYDTEDVRRIYYTLSGFNMTKIENDTWALVLPSSKTVTFNIDNMLTAITVLKAFGVPVSVETIMNDTRDLDKFQQEIETGLAELRKNEEEEE